MIDYQYVDRAKCECGYIWTTVGKNPPQTISDSIICDCGGLQFKDGVLIGASLAIDEEEFKLEVDKELGIGISNFTVSKYIE